MIKKMASNNFLLYYLALFNTINMKT